MAGHSNIIRVLAYELAIAPTAQRETTILREARGILGRVGMEEVARLAGEYRRTRRYPKNLKPSRWRRRRVFNDHAAVARQEAGGRSFT